MADVLVVDDDEVIRGMLAFLFEGAGHTVEQAADGSEALEVLRNRPPECMVLDLMMPGIDGLSVLQTRQREGIAPQTRVIVLTAKSGTEDAVWCWEAGADEFITKPFDPERLLKLVKDLSRLTPAEARRRRQLGLADSRRIDAIEAALRGRTP
jgi:DNA-binding response OmpR family regulator